MRQWLLPLLYLSNNWLSLAGVVLVTTATIFWLFLLPSTLAGEVHPYLGILSYLAIPGAFFAGLALIPAGIWMRRRAGGEAPRDLGRLVRFVAVATVINIGLASQFSYRAVHYMDSSGFCGTACHGVMKPEYAAHQRSPHASVECVRCHIGPGADHFFKAKLSGLRQVISLASGDYHRPIPPPLDRLRPAREICESCHSGKGRAAESLRVRWHFDVDEKNSRSANVLLMRTGRIHSAHTGVRFRADGPARAAIPLVEVRGAAAIAEGKSERDAPEPWRTMDCLDCHNRPSHTFETPEAAVEAAMSAGLIPQSLKGARKKAAELLTADYTGDAGAAIRSAWLAAYPGEERGAQALAEARAANVFPEMRVGWGTYPDHRGHQRSPGCFRCHDGRKTPAGGQITQDCNACHQLVAMDETDPKVLSDLGVKPDALAPRVQ